MKNRLLNLLDAPALLVAMIVDMALVGLALWIIGPGLLEKIALCMLGAVAVLFAVRAWLKGGALGYALWAMFAAVAFFLDLSFALAATDPALVPKAPDNSKLDLALTGADARVSTLQADYRAAMNRATMDQLDGQIKAAQAVADGYRADLRAASNPQSGSLDRVTSASLSVAIYAAGMSGDPGRVSFLVLFILLFAGLQLTMVAAATETKKKSIEALPVQEPSKPAQAPPRPEQSNPPQAPAVPEHKPRPQAYDAIDRWVRVTWVNYRNGRGTSAIGKERFDKITEKNPFPDGLWEAITRKAEAVGVIVGNVIQEPDETKAAEKIRSEFGQRKL